MKPRQPSPDAFRHGDRFLLPLSDDRLVEGQVIYAVPIPGVPIVAICEPASGRTAATPVAGPKRRKLILSCAVTPDRLESGAWSIQGCDAEAIDGKLLKVVLDLAQRRFIGLTIVGSEALVRCLELHFDTPRSRSFSEATKRSCRALLDGNSDAALARFGIRSANLKAHRKKSSASRPKPTA